MLKVDRDDHSVESLQAELPEGGALFLGDCLGVALIPRNDRAPLIQLLVEDDGNWFPKAMIFDIFWAKELRELLTKAILSIS